MKRTAKEYIEGLLKKEIIDFNNPTCMGCNDCCCITAAITEEEFKFYKKYFKKHKNILMEAKNRYRKAAEKANAINLMCPFTTANKRCSIYSIRPRICRNFHCSPAYNKGDREELVEQQRYTIYDIFR